LRGQGGRRKEETKNIGKEEKLTESESEGDGRITLPLQIFMFAVLYFYFFTQPNY